MKYTKEQREWILNNYKGKGPKLTAELFNKEFGTKVTRSMMKSYFGNHKLNSGVKGHFPKGHVPANKGTKGKYNVGGNKTSYKKGQTPINHRPVGSERIDSDGYVLIKVAEPNVWKQKHRAVWEEHHGPIPAKHRLIFLNGNRQDIRIDNLVLVTYGESAVMNKLRLLDENPKITEVGVSIAKLMTKTSKKAIKERSKG